MKRLLSLFLILALLLSGCGQSRVENPPASLTPAPDMELTAQLLLENILPAVPEGSEAHEIVAAADIPVFLEIYGLSGEQVLDCAIARMGGARVFEIAVIHAADGAEDAVGEVLSAYLLQRQGDFTGYAPDQAALAERGAILTAAPWLVLVISEDTDAAKAAFGACVGGEVSHPTPSPAVTTEPTEEPPPKPSPEPTEEPSPEPAPEPTEEPTPEPTVEPTPEPAPEPTVEPSTEPSPEPTEELSPEPTVEPFKRPSGWKKYIPPHTDDMTIYDTSAILAAWEAGSAEGLNRRDKWTYERCAELIGQLITEDMTDYEKEWAIYRWLSRNVVYDWRQNDPAQTAPRSSFQPYGAIVEQTAVCLGYASAFQLFMDLLDVECITVLGAAFNSSGDHAWNMVKLNGEWYCVDVTWDLNRSSPESCSYFNVTSDHMAKTDHQWDYANTPMATATDEGKG